jgi:tetratricopeptide (TPR) repeat protein
MAAIALSRNQHNQAGSFFARLLELNPADADAIAGLTSLQQGDPAQSESRLKKMLAQDPQSGAVLFELGNLNARQSRWSEAQQYYFRALGSAPGNPDYAFNLAVSLDRLNQDKLALEYYQKALALAQNGPAGFSKAAAQARSKELQATLAN